MNRRLVFATLAVVVLIALAGCTDFLGPREIPDDTLDESGEYEWETDANATIVFEEDDEYRAVYRVSDDTFRVYQTDRLNNDRHVNVRAVRYRYPNGTVLNGSDLSIETTRTGTIIDLPADEGQVAYTATIPSKRFDSPVLTEGSHEVILPPDHRVGNILFGQVRPGGYETEYVDDRRAVRWDDTPDGQLRVHFYLQRDVYIFGGGFALVVAVALGAATRVYMQIRTLRRERDELGLSFDPDDEGGN